MQSPLTGRQRLMGASLLVFNNKTDVADGMRADEVRKVSIGSPDERRVC